MRAQLANGFTLLRIALIPVAIILQQSGTAAALGWCLVVMGLAEVSDILDGQLARRYSGVSGVGKLIDPMADSLYRTSVFVAFAVTGWMPLWMVLVFVWRDTMVAYLRSYAASRGVVLAARTSGKIKAVLQAITQIATVLVFWLIATYPRPDGMIPVLGVDPYDLTFVLLCVATAWTAFSAVDYLRGTLKAVPLTQSDSTK